MQQLLIFGISDTAAQVVLEAESDGRYEVVGFVAAAAAPAQTFLGRPVFDPGTAQQQFDRRSIVVFACGDARYLNQDRLAAYIAAKGGGYKVASIVSGSAVIAQDVRIRENVFVGANVRIHAGCSIGANVWILNGASLGVGSRVGSSSWIGEGCILGDRSAVGRNCTFAHGVSVRAGVSVGPWSAINRGIVLDVSYSMPRFIDPRFRAEVVIRGGPEQR